MPKVDQHSARAEKRQHRVDRDEDIDAGGATHASQNSIFRETLPTEDDSDDDAPVANSKVSLDPFGFILTRIL